MVGILILAGCSFGHGGLSVGSLGKVDGGGSGCSSLTQHGHVYHSVLSGWETLDNSADTPVTVIAVKVTDVRGVHVRWVKLAPIVKDGRFTTLIGNWRGPWDAHTRESMAAAYPAIGGKIPAHTQVGLVLSVAVPDPSHTAGHMGPIQVTYADAGGDKHLWTGGDIAELPGEL